MTSGSPLPTPILLAALIALAGCDRGQSATEAPAPPAASAAAAPAGAPAAASTDAAWQTAGDSHALIGTTAPPFRAQTYCGAPPDGQCPEVTHAGLAGRWTILAFWGLWSDDSIADARYIQALNSAAGQDPDLDFLSVHSPPSPDRADEALGDFLSLGSWFKDQGGAWPTLVDADGAIAAAYRIDSAPVYLLIGPDLTIEAYRTDLSSTPDDGIKSVIRGVAAIRKQIAAPG